MSATYIHKRGEVYYFRLRIPLDVKHHFQRNYLYKSLKTEVKTTAKKRVSILLHKAIELFDRIRSGLYKDQIDSLIYSFMNTELGLDSRTPHYTPTPILTVDDAVGLAADRSSEHLPFQPVQVSILATSYPLTYLCQVGS